MSKHYVAYRVRKNGSMESLRIPSGKRVFGLWGKRYVIARAKARGYKVIVRVFEKSKQPEVRKGRANRKMVSKHFSWSEFACKDGHPVPDRLRPNARRLAGALEKVRARVGKPIPLLSVYRTPTHNKAVHGARFSQHIQATAADINVKALAKHGVSHSQLLHACESVPEIHGIGIYPDGSIHVDVRAGRRVRWSSYVRT